MCPISCSKCELKDKTAAGGVVGLAPEARQAIQIVTLLAADRHPQASQLLLPTIPCADTSTFSREGAHRVCSRTQRLLFVQP